MRLLRTRVTEAASFAPVLLALVALATLSACGGGGGADTTEARLSEASGGGEASPYLFRPPSTEVRSTCEAIEDGAIRVEGDSWSAVADGTLYTEGVYHCTAVGMVMAKDGGRVYALGHFGGETLETDLAAMAAALEAAGGRRGTLETVVGQGGVNERSQMALTLQIIDRLDLNLVQVISNQYDDDDGAAMLEFAFDGLVFRYKRSLACRLAFAS